MVVIVVIDKGVVMVIFITGETYSMLNQKETTALGALQGTPTIIQIRVKVSLYTA